MLQIYKKFISICLFNNFFLNVYFARNRLNIICK